jgi:hypothetical protein
LLAFLGCLTSEKKIVKWTFKKSSRLFDQFFVVSFAVRHVFGGWPM